MQTKSWALALALALASTTLAESRPRIYFPRHVKRQFTNSNETRDSVFPAAESTPEPKVEGQNDENGFRDPTEDDSRGSQDGFLQGSNPDSSSVQETLATRSEDESDVLTIAIPNTVLVQSTGTPSSDEEEDSAGPVANTDARPTDLPNGSLQEEEDDEETTETTEPSSETSAETPDSTDDEVITIAPTGVVEDEDSQETPKSPQTDQTDNPEEVEQVKNDGEEQVVEEEEKEDDEGGLLDDLGDLLGVGDKEEDDEDEDVLPPVIPILGGGNSTKTPDTDEPTETTPADDTDDTNEDGEPSTLPDEDDLPKEDDDTIPPSEEEGEKDDDQEPDEDEDDLDDETPIPVVTPPPDPSTILDPILDPISSIVSDIEDDIPIPPVLNDTDPIGNGTDITITIPDPLPTDVPTDPVTPSDTPTVLPPDPVTDTPTPTDVPGGTGEPSGPSETITTTPEPTLVPGGVGDDSSSDGPSSSRVGNSTNSNHGNGPPEPTDAVGPGVVEPTTTVTSIAVLSTVTGTQSWLGTELAADKTASAEEVVEAPAPTHSAETLPAGMPKTIEASEEENLAQPEGSEAIRIVFDRRLHYEFVADNFTAAQQILSFVPKIISFGENVDISKIRMMRLAPVNSNTEGWFPTGAYLYVPASIISSLSADIHLPNSLLYHHPSPIGFQLAAAIDPSFGIIPGSENDRKGEEVDPGGAPFTNSEEKPEEQSPQQQGATAGIAMGAVTVAVAYGAAMFIVARRYKRKKQAHQRTSSITNSSDMRYSPSGSPAMMGGALLSRDFSGYGGVAGGRQSHGSGRSGAGNSGRTAYISPPVAAENSLGWN